ncbi:MAG: MotE family protein, partial [Micavibrio aeruginosavorus]|nr:MotE family protein [Micavibrio aeruginosavorus]
DFIHGLENMGAARAQSEVKAEPPPMNAVATKAAEKPEEHAEEAAPAEIEGRLDLEQAGNDVKLKPEFEKEAQEAPAATASVPGPDAPGEKVEWRDSIDADIDESAVRDDLYKDLAKRRDQLDKKEKEIAVREALLSAAERELDQKLRELTNIRSEIEASMKKRSDEEQARIDSLVKIYEGMKPKDAASILNSLDLDVLMVIMTKMTERKSSAILSEMSTDRARTITTMMAAQRQDPALAPQN